MNDRVDIPADVFVDAIREPEEPEIFIDDDEIEVLTDKKVCVFWSHRNADRVSIAASVENQFDKTSSNYDSCACPDMEADAALPACTYQIMEQGDEEIYCPFYKAEADYLLFETSKGKVCTTRILDFEEMNMDRVFTVTMTDGSTEEFEDPTEAYAKIRE